MATVRDALRDALGQGWDNCDRESQGRIDEDITTVAYVLGRIDPDMDVDALRRRLLYGERVDTTPRRWTADCPVIDGEDQWGAEGYYAWLTRPEDAE